MPSDPKKVKETQHKYYLAHKDVIIARAKERYWRRKELIGSEACEKERETGGPEKESGAQKQALQRDAFKRIADLRNKYLKYHTDKRAMSWYSSTHSMTIQEIRRRVDAEDGLLQVVREWCEANRETKICIYPPPLPPRSVVSSGDVER